MKLTSIFIIFLVFSTIYLPVNLYAQSNTNSMALCPIAAEIPPRPKISDPLEENDIYVIADQMEYTEGGISYLIGNAELAYNEQQVTADRIEFDDSQNSVALQGGVNYWDNEVYINSPGANIDLDSDIGNFDDVEYWLLGNRGRGNADNVTINLGETTVGERVDYTTCDPDVDSPWNLTTNIWKFSAGKLILNHESERGTGRNVILKIKDIPVFYTPYISFPISDRRKSGLLVPIFGSSSRHGFEFQAPYYWNINPKMDATITPRLISNSGVMMIGEYRYLFNKGQGLINLEYLPNDSVLNGKDRSSIALLHRQSFLNSGRLSLNYNRVSDRDYLEDFSSSLVGTSARFLQQSAIFSYSWQINRHHLSIYNQVGNYQIVDRNIPLSATPYKRLPSTTIILKSPNENSRLNYNFVGKFDNFSRGEDILLNNVNGVRYDLFPSISFPEKEISYYIIPKAGIRYTSYRLNENKVFNNRHPDRIVPVLSVDSGLFFQRNTTIFGESILQTLLPRLYYLYIPEHDQSDLPVFDTGQYTTSYASLFYNNRFNGSDRVGDANQISLAVSTRWYSSESGQSLGSFSIGQAIHLDDRNVVLPGRPVQNATFSEIIARFETNMFKDIALMSEFQWDPDLNRTQKLTFNAQYRPDEARVVNIGYRKHQSNPNTRIVNIFNVDQADISFRWPLNREWSIVGKWNFAVEESRSLDLFSGIEYNSCCWGLRIVARRFLSSLAGEYDTGVFMQFELKGLAGLGEKTVDFLTTSIPGYESEF